MSEVVPVATKSAWKKSIQKRTTTLEPDQAIRLILALNYSDRLDASLVSPPLEGFDEPLIAQLAQNPTHAEAVVHADPAWLDQNLKKQICTKLFEGLDAKLGTPDVGGIFASIWAYIQSDHSVLDVSTDARNKGNLVLLFKQALDSENDKLASEVFLVECLGSKKSNAPQYANRNVDGIGSVHDAVNYYNERINNASLVSDVFIQHTASAIANPKRGQPFRELALDAPAGSVFREAFRRAVDDDDFSSPKWGGAIQTYDKVRDILGEELFGRWLESITSHSGQPDFSYPIPAQIKLSEDIEHLQLKSLQNYVDAQNKRFHELSEDEWNSSFEDTNGLLPLLKSRLNSKTKPLSGLASAARISLRKHFAQTLKGEATWIDGDFYDRMFDAFTPSSKTALRLGVAEDLSNISKESAVILKLASAAPEIFWKLPIHKSANEFMRNIFCPLIGEEIEFLVEFAEKRPHESKKIFGELNDDTAKLVGEDIAAAFSAADEERREQITIVAKAFGIKIDKTKQSES